MKNFIILGVVASIFSFSNVQGATILSVENTTASISETLIDKIKVKIRNKSGKSQDIYYTNANGGGKTTGTLSANSTQTISIEPGGKVYTKQGVLLLTVTAIMAGSEQTIIK